MERKKECRWSYNWYIDLRKLNENEFETLVDLFYIMLANMKIHNRDAYIIDNVRVFNLIKSDNKKIIEFRKNFDNRGDCLFYTDQDHSKGSIEVNLPELKRDLKRIIGASGRYIADITLDKPKTYSIF